MVAGYRSLEGGDLRDDLPADDLDGVDPLHAAQGAQGSVGAGLRQGREVVEHLGNALPVVADVHDVVDGLHDAVEVAADCLAVPAKHVELGPQLFRTGEEVAGVRVLRHEAQGLALAAAPDEDPRPGYRYRRPGVYPPGQVVVLALQT